MTSEGGNGLSLTRIRNAPSANITYLECPICHDLLWKPVACQTCEKPFCFTCIGKWLSNNPNKCPNRCATYVERKCPPLCASLLAELQISCFYQSKGCQQVLSYEALDKHEVDCGFQPKQCAGCRSEIPKKDLVDHENQCGSIQLSCPDCKLVYQRQEAAIKHSENICLKEQLRELNRQLTDMQLANPVRMKRTINFSDLPDAAAKVKAIPTTYQGMRWTGISYMHKEYVNRSFPRSGYPGAFLSNGSSHVAWLKDEGSLSVQSVDDVFTLVSVTACAAWNDSLQLTFTGHKRSTQVDTHTVILLFGKPQMIFLQWENIDKVVFKAEGGTPHPETGATTSTAIVVMTQLTLS